MDCRTAQKLLKLYYNNSLKQEDANDFIEHVLNCNSCKEELSIYYIVDACNNDNEPKSYNFIELVEEDLLLFKRKLNNHTKFVITRMFSWTLSNVIIVMTLIGWILNFWK